MNMPELGERGKWVFRGLFGLGLIFLAYILSGIILTGVMTLATLGIAGLVVAAASASWGMVSFKFTNWVMDKYIEEAYKNPATTRRQIHGEMLEALQKASQQLTEAFKAVGIFETRIKSLEKQGYHDDAEALRVDLRNLQEMNREEMEALEAGREAAAEYDRQTDRVQAVWEAAQAGLAASKRAGGSAKKEALRKIQSDTAIRAADDAMAGVRARLLELQTKKSVGGRSSPQLEFAPSPSLGATRSAVPLQHVERVK